MLAQEQIENNLTVPVAMTSPGCSVWPSEIVLISVGIEKIKSSVVASCRSSPLTCVWTCSFFGKYDAGTAKGPCRKSVSLPCFQSGYTVHVDPGTYHRAICIRRLSEKKLFVVSLALSRSHVINNGVSPDII
jgi:hypothetical protein